MRSTATQSKMESFFKKSGKAAMQSGKQQPESILAQSFFFLCCGKFMASFVVKGEAAVGWFNGSEPALKHAFMKCLHLVCMRVCLQNGTQRQSASSRPSISKDDRE